MKIFAVSDIHGDDEALSKIVNFANSRDDIDTVVFCGDIARDHDYLTIKELSSLQSENYSYFKYLISEIQSKKVYYILGNHDVFEVDKYDMNYLPNAVKAGFEHTFIPFELIQIRFYDTDRECTEEGIKTALNKIDNIDENKIFVAHQPPFNCLDSTVRGFSYGSISIREMIYDKKPKIFLCGHIHESFGVRRLGKTLVVNCACRRKITRGWVVDTDTLAYWQITL